MVLSLDWRHGFLLYVGCVQRELAWLAIRPSQPHPVFSCQEHDTNMDVDSKDAGPKARERNRPRVAQR